MNRTQACCVVALAWMGCSKRQMGMEARQANEPTASASDVAAAVRSLPDPDRGFVTQAASANMAAIRYGQLAAERGSSDGVRQFGRDLADQHTALMDHLRESATRQGVTLPLAAPDAMAQRTLLSLQTLTGPDFDRAFLSAVEELQGQTVSSFQNEAVHGQVPDLARLANEALPSMSERVRSAQREMQRM